MTQNNTTTTTTTTTASPTNVVGSPMDIDEQELLDQIANDCSPEIIPDIFIGGGDDNDIVVATILPRLHFQEIETTTMNDSAFVKQLQTPCVRKKVTTFKKLTKLTINIGTSNINTINKIN